MPDIVNVFADLQSAAWPYEYQGTLHANAILGGTPSDPAVAESWIKAKLSPDSDERLRQLVAEVMLERNLDMTAAVAEVNKMKHTNGFRRDSALGMYIEGRQLKAALKEAVSVAVASPEGKLARTKWGTTSKFLTNYFPEHVFVMENKLYLRHASDGQQSSAEDVVTTWRKGDAVHQPSDILQTFPMNARVRQTGIQYTEVCRDVEFDFTILTDHPFTREEWGMIWLTGQYQGIGAQRSQGYGVYTPTRWQQVRGPVVKPKKVAEAIAPTAENAPDITY